MNRKKTAYALIAGLALIAAGIFACKKVPHYELSRFVSPETCGGCHDTIYSQWKNSMHSLAHHDPVYRAVSLSQRAEVTDPDEVAEAESCVKCHTPLGPLSGKPTRLSDEFNGIPDLVAQGIQCDYCHSAKGARQAYNNGIELDPGQGEANPGTKRGPYRDSKSDFHGTAYSAFHESAEICGTCHDVRHVSFGTKLETTYEEWTRSPYNSPDPAKRITCQGCHMYQRPGVPATGSTERPKNPGLASADGPKREHVFTHYFVGANSFVPGALGDKEKNGMAVERLLNAATLSIDGSATASGKLKITVTNTGAGHYLPTGLTDTRQMWLAITVRDGSGKTVYTSGTPDAKGYLPAGTIMYNTVFGDGKGKPVNNVSKAREVLRDHRIPPQGSVTETISLEPPKARTLTVSVELLYRGASQEYVDKVMGKKAVKLPIVTMTSIKQKIAL